MLIMITRITFSSIPKLFLNSLFFIFLSFPHLFSACSDLFKDKDAATEGKTSQKGNVIAFSTGSQIDGEGSSLHGSGTKSTEGHPAPIVDLTERKKKAPKKEIKRQFLRGNRLSGARQGEML